MMSHLQWAFFKTHAVGAGCTNDSPVGHDGCCCASDIPAIKVDARNFHFIRTANRKYGVRVGIHFKRHAAGCGKILKDLAGLEIVNPLAWKTADAGGVGGTKKRDLPAAIAALIAA